MPCKLPRRRWLQRIALAGAPVGLWLGLGVGLLTPAATAAANAPLQPATRPAAFQVHFHVGSADPTRTERRIETWLAEANAAFKQAGVRFEGSRAPDMPDSFHVVETIRERRGVKRRLVKHRINVFVADRIEDPHPSAATQRAASWQGFGPSGLLAGAHIEAPGHTPATYVLIASTASPTTLAHELGHVLGLPHHRDPVNIMSYGRARQHFDTAQLTHLRRRARRLRSRRILRVARE